MIGSALPPQRMIPTLADLKGHACPAFVSMVVFAVVGFAGQMRRVGGDGVGAV